jgi:hypothetical protein
MQITFRASPELLKVGEIGESIVEAGDSLRRHVISAVLGAIRDGGIPLRTESGIKVSSNGLNAAKRSAQLTARHKAEVRASKPSILNLELNFLHEAKARYIESEASMQAIARGTKIPEYDAQILDLTQKLEYLKQGDLEMQAIDERIEQDAIYRNQFVLFSELADYLRTVHGFEVVIAAWYNGEIAQKLAKSFDIQMGDLPPRLREIAEAYIPNWPEMSGAERRARADEADIQLQATLGARLEHARTEAEQANAATPARFAQRNMQDGFNKVEREKKGERDFEAKLGVVNLSHERCIELAHSQELRIADWIELTGVGPGWCVAYLITKQGVSFRAWDDGHINDSPLDEQREMERDNEQPPLKFPCTPIELLHFVDTARHDLYGFSVPDAFRQAVTEIAPTTDTPPQAPEKPQEQIEAGHSGASEVTHGDGDEQSEAGTPTEPHKIGLPAQRFQEEEIMRVIFELGYVAQAIPKWTRGKPGVKAEVRGKLKFPPKVFNKAWERLRAERKINEPD